MVNLKCAHYCDISESAFYRNDVMDAKSQYLPNLFDSKVKISQEEVSDALHTTEEILKEILRRVDQNGDTIYRKTYIKAGSHPSATKIRKPNEFDFNVPLKQRFFLPYARSRTVPYTIVSEETVRKYLYCLFNLISTLSYRALIFKTAIFITLNLFSLDPLPRIKAMIHFFYRGFVGLVITLCEKKKKLTGTVVFVRITDDGSVPEMRILSIKS